MKRIGLIFAVFTVGLMSSCISSADRGEGSNVDQNPKENLEEQLKYVRLAINPSYEDWVLFEYGTYIIFDSLQAGVDIEQEALRLMKEFGPVQIGGLAGDFNVSYLKTTVGWAVSSHGPGMYTYVHPSELETDQPTDLEIGLYGRSKRHMDGENPVVVYVNRKLKQD